MLTFSPRRKFMIVGNLIPVEHRDYQANPSTQADERCPLGCFIYHFSERARTAVPIFQQTARRSRAYTCARLMLT